MKTSYKTNAQISFTLYEVMAHPWRYGVRGEYSGEYNGVIQESYPRNLRTLEFPETISEEIQKDLIEKLKNKSVGQQ
jgi:hypothetical protein